MADSESAHAVAAVARARDIVGDFQCAGDDGQEQV